MDVEKLAINREAFESVIAPLLPNNNAMYDALAKYTTDEFNGQYVDGDVQKAWVKFQALQSSEPVYQIIVEGAWRDVDKLIYDNIQCNSQPKRILFTHPPASVSLEKYNRAIEALKCIDEDLVNPVYYRLVKEAIAEAEGK